MFEGVLKELRPKIILEVNLRQNIWNNVRSSSELGQYRKKTLSAFE